MSALLPMVAMLWPGLLDVVLAGGARGRRIRVGGRLRQCFGDLYLPVHIGVV
jgi:hypothetical protein